MSPSPVGSRSQIVNLALAVLFLGAIWLPLLVQGLGLNPTGLAENRTRAPRPELRLDRQSLAEFPAQFEAYFRDSFGLRDQLIRGNNLARVFVLNTSPSSKVVIGKRGWLFLKDFLADDLRGNHPLKPEELEQWRRTYVERRDWLARRGIQYLVMFAPNKHTIYPELVPGTYDRVTPESRYEQLYRYLRETTDLQVVDLREPLLHAKASGRLYFRRDTHWNDSGAYVAYRVIMQRLSQYFPGLRATPRSDFRLARLNRPNPDLALMLGLGDVLPELDVALEPKAGFRAQRADPGPGLSDEDAMTCAGGDLPRAVVFRDSFSIALIPLLSEHFARSLYLWRHKFDPAIIERERPQVVLEETVERMLWMPAPASGLPEALIARK